MVIKLARKQENLAHEFTKICAKLSSNQGPFSGNIIFSIEISIPVVDSSTGLFIVTAPSLTLGLKYKTRLYLVVLFTVSAICHNVSTQFGTAKDQLKELESLIPANSYYKCVCCVCTHVTCDRYIPSMLISVTHHMSTRNI